MEIPAEESVGEGQYLYRRQEQMHRDDQRCRGLGSVYKTLNSSMHSPSDRLRSGGSCVVLFSLTSTVYFSPSHFLT